MTDTTHTRSRHALFECTDCGTRVLDARTRRCECGGTLQNLSVERHM